MDELPVILFDKSVWIESDIFGNKHVMVQHQAPGSEPVCYCTFHYHYEHTSNAFIRNEAERVARALGAQIPIEHRNRYD